MKILRLCVIYSVLVIVLGGGFFLKWLIDRLILIDLCNPYPWTSLFFFFGKYFVSSEINGNWRVDALFYISYNYKNYNFFFYLNLVLWSLNVCLWNASNLFAKTAKENFLYFKSIEQVMPRMRGGRSHNHS